MASTLIDPARTVDARKPLPSPPRDPRPALWRDRPLLLLLCLVLLLQSWSWWQLDGYQLGDSVEYMERARAAVSGHSLHGEGRVRSFGFSSLLVPFFWLGDRLSLEDPRVLVHAIRLFQMALGLALVVVCARIGARIAGSSAGLAAAFIAGVNPIFLQYSVDPVSGIAAALFIGLGVWALLEPGPRRGLAGGLALGAALLMAYQTVLIALPVMLLVALRNGRRGKHQTLSMLCGYALGVMAQVGLDRLTYGEYGLTLVNYLLENVGTRLSLYVHHLGFSELAHSIYSRSLVGGDPDMEMYADGPVAVRNLYYYVQEIETMLVAPIAAFTLLGLLVAAARPRWGATLVTLVLVVNVVVMSSKSAKSFRLWLPLIPLIAPLAGMGVMALVGTGRARLRRPRQVLAWGGLLAGLVLGVQTLHELNSRRYGVYWHAMAHINRTVAAEREAFEAALEGELAASEGAAEAAHDDDGEEVEDAEPPAFERPTVGSAYHWAVFLRDSPDIHLLKLPHHLDRWLSLDLEAQAETLMALSQLDWLILHRPVLEQERTLFDVIASGFEVVAGFWSPYADPVLGPVLVLRRAGLDPRARPLIRSLITQDPRGWRREHGLDRQLPNALAFLEFPEGPDAVGLPATRRLVYLGWRSLPLAGSGLRWLEHHWWTDTGMVHDWIIVDRITDPTGKRAWQNNHEPGYGFRPTSTWAPGELLVEGYALMAGEKPFTPEYAPMGGPWRRGDLIPVWMWLQLASDDKRMDVVIDRKLPIRQDLDLPPEQTWFGSSGPQGRGRELIHSPDRLVRAGSFFLPVEDGARWADDGRPDPE